MNRSFGSASLRIGLVALASLSIGASARAGVVYLETFEGETSYPTSPEIDVLGLGGTTGGAAGAGTPVAPTLTGTAAAEQVTSVGGLVLPPSETTGVGLSSGALTDLGVPFVVTASVSGFDVIGSLAGGDLNLASGLVGLLVHDPSFGYFVSASLYVFRAGEYSQVLVYVSEFFGGQTLRLEGSVLADFVVGNAFDLELVVDPVLASAVARVTSDGVTTSSPAIPLSAYNTQLPRGVTQILNVDNSAPGTPSPIDMGAGDRAVVDLLALRIDTVPEPALAWLAVLALAGVALRRGA